MGEKEVTEALVKVGSEVVKDVYADGLRRTVSAIGNAVGSVAEFGSNVVQFFAGTIDRGFKRLTGRVTPRIEEIPEHRRQLPSTRLLLQASASYAALDDDPESDTLREFFENLLLSLMDREAPKAHPALVSILSELSPTEAWILKAMGEESAFPILRLTKGSFFVLGIACTLSEELDVTPPDALLAFTNLERLGVIEYSDSASLSKKGDVFLAWDRLQAVAERRMPGQSMGHWQLSIRVTQLGMLLLDTSVRKRRDVRGTA